jgi:hypothetical protein
LSFNSCHLCPLVNDLLQEYILHETTGGHTHALATDGTLKSTIDGQTIYTLTTECMAAMPGVFVCHEQEYEYKLADT